MNSRSQPAVRRALLLWVILLMVSLPLGVTITLTYGPHAPLGSLLVFMTIGLVVALSLPGHHPHARFGLANSVTLVRSALVSWLAGFVLIAHKINDPVFAWSLVSAGFVVLLLDGLDGWLARKTGQATQFGARFDMEIDSLFAIVLSLLVWQLGKVGLWVLLLGLPRPLFIVASWIEPRLKSPLPESMIRKTICVVQIAALIMLLAPIWDRLASHLLAVLVLTLLGWSFWRDARWLISKQAAS